MVVIYAEKPDMGEKIAAALGGSSFHKAEKKNGYYMIRYKGTEYAVTWGYGHLCALAEAVQYNPEYKNWSKLPIPFIPKDYKVVLNEKSKMPVKEAYRIVKQLFDRADYVINATDFAREGELIFYYLYHYMGCRKPVMRAKLVSTTKDGIEDSFDHLLDSSDFAGILASAQCRSITDWVVGCNLTVAMTLQYGGRNIYSIGRVQTPTLAMVVERDEQIKNFKPEDYFTVEGVFTTATDKTYEGVHEQKRFDKKEDADAIVSRCRGHKGIVADIETTEEKELVPHLYSLDSLQMDANEKYGLNLKHTLDLVQKLYEKGLVTYPRTDCQYLPDDMVGKIQQVHSMLRSNGFGHLFGPEASDSNMLKNKKRFFDTSKVGSHFAIIPTGQVPSGLSSDEKKVYGLIADSVIRMLYEAAVIEKTKVTTTVNGESFITNGKSLKYDGWMFVNGSTKEEFIPALKIGDQVDPDISSFARKTKPPKHYTDKSLLAAMLSAGRNLEDKDLKKFMAEQKIDGVGTVATRASIIETLVARGMVVRDKKNILATERGINLIHAIPVEAVKSAALTAQCEKKLNMIMNHEMDTGSFLNGIYKDVADWCGEIKKVSVAPEASSEKPGLDLMCPVCGSPLNKFNWGYGCSEHKNGCKFAVGAICGKLLTEGQLRTLLSKEKIGPLAGFKRKDGGSFEASLKLEPVIENGETVNYKVVFDVPKSQQNENRDLYATCPKCHKRIVRGKWGWECEAKCGISVPYTLCEKKIEPEVAESLFTHGCVAMVEGFISKKGRPFNAGLTLKGNKVEFVFPEKI